MPPSLLQPILSDQPEHGHNPKDVISFEEFISLLEKEEDYFKEDRHNTKRLITRLRKIFYDKSGWNRQLIRKARFIKGRYNVKLIDCPPVQENETAMVKKVKRYHDHKNQAKCRMVTYPRNDREFGNTRAGKIPNIYKLDHQDVYLPEKYHCDLGHTFAGLDALNNPQLVSPIPWFLGFLRRFFPTVESNADVATWLGDIATICTDLLFFHLRTNEMPSEEDKQHFINSNATASDMLGNMDAYVIKQLFDVGNSIGRQVTEIFSEYYENSETGNAHREKRFAVFCESVGLKNWNGSSFKNEEEWLSYYSVQLRNTVAFMVFSFADGFEKLFLAVKVIRRRFENIIEVKMLLGLFLKELKKELSSKNIYYDT